MTEDNGPTNEGAEDPGPTNTPSTEDPGPTNEVDDSADRAHEADAAEADPAPGEDVPDSEGGEA